MWLPGGGVGGGDLTEVAVNTLFQVQSVQIVSAKGSSFKNGGGKG